MTKISITIPTYNGEKNIKKQIDRLINDCKKAKIFNFYEIIICDNCSNDNTKKIVTKYKRKINTKKIFDIKFYGSKSNLGYPKNFIRATKLSKSKYTIFLCDDNIPGQNFYIKLYNLFKNKDYNELCFFSTNNIPNFKKKSGFDFRELAYVMNRGAILSGALLQTKKIKHKYIIKNNLYPQNSVFIDYYLKYGLKTFNFKSKINCNTNESIKSKFKDRMKRKHDLAVMDKINSIDIFYEKKRINFYSLFICIYTIYFWSFDVYMTLKKQGEQKIANNFFKAITSYKRKSLILISMFLVFLKHIF